MDKNQQEALSLCYFSWSRNIADLYFFYAHICSLEQEDLAVFLSALIESEQVDDFSSLLEDAGFQAPLAYLYDLSLKLQESSFWPKDDEIIAVVALYFYSKRYKALPELIEKHYQKYQLKRQIDALYEEAPPWLLEKFLSLDAKLISLKLKAHPAFKRRGGLSLKHLKRAS